MVNFAPKGFHYVVVQVWGGTVPRHMSTRAWARGYFQDAQYVHRTAKHRKMASTYGGTVRWPTSLWRLRRRRSSRPTPTTTLLAADFDLIVSAAPSVVFALLHVVWRCLASHTCGCQHHICRHPTSQVIVILHRALETRQHSDNRSLCSLINRHVFSFGNVSFRIAVKCRAVEVAAALWPQCRMSAFASPASRSCCSPLRPIVPKAIRGRRNEGANRPFGQGKVDRVLCYSFRSSSVACALSENATLSTYSSRLL